MTVSSAPTPGAPPGKPLLPEREHSHTNGRYYPGWFRFARQVIIFLLGVAVIIYATTNPGNDIALDVVGLVLIGLVPVDELLTRVPTQNQRPGE